MRSYPNINFNAFSTVEICDFMSARVHKDISTLLENIQQAFNEGENLFSQTDHTQILPLLFTQLKDECSQLLRLESHAFFPFLKANLKAGKIEVNEKTAERLFHYQELILALFYRIKLSMNNFLGKDPYLSGEQIIINDLAALEILLLDWIYLVQNKITNPHSTINSVPL